MPAVVELSELHAMADADHLDPLPITVDDDARTAMTASLDSSGLLLLGEMHGVRQTPQVIAGLVELLDLRTVALEWPAPLTGTVDAYRDHGVLHDHPLLWLGDGRLTPGHLALLRDLARAVPAVDWLAFDSWAVPPTVPGESLWTARDQAMARRVLDHRSPAGRTLVVAGNAHTGTTRSNLGIPMGAWIIRDRPAVRSVRIRYGNGTIYNLGSRKLTTRHRPQSYRLHLDDGLLVLDHPSPTEAAVPHHDDPLPPLDPDT